MRHFKIVSADVQYTPGRYSAEKPKDVARKVAITLFKKSCNKKTINFTIKETTRGSNHKVYSYTSMYKNRIQIISKKRVGGADTFPLTQEFILHFQNEGYLFIDFINQRAKINFTKTKNNAVIWKVDKSEHKAIDKRPLYNIYSNDDEHVLGVEKIQIGNSHVENAQTDNDSIFVPRLGIRVNFYYEKGNLYPYVVNNITRTIVEYPLDYLRVEFV